MESEESETGICLENYCLVERSLVPETNNKTCAGFPWGAPEMGRWSPVPKAEIREHRARELHPPKGERLGAELQTLRVWLANQQGGPLGSVHPPCSHLDSNASTEIIPAPLWHK